MRGVISTIFSLCYSNVNLKYVVYDSIPRHQFTNLLKRSLQASSLILIQFSIVKYLSLIFIGISQNCTPLVTVFMSFYMTGEKIRCFDFVLIFITFIGVMLVILGIESQKKNAEGMPIYATIGAFMIPFLLSYGNIIMSQMRGLHENTVSLYINPTLGILMYMCMKNAGLDC